MHKFLTHSTVGSLYEALLLDAVYSIYKAPLTLGYQDILEGKEDWEYIHTFTPTSYPFSFYVIAHMFEREPSSLSSSIEKYLITKWKEKKVYTYAQALYYN